MQVLIVMDWVYIQPDCKDLCAAHRKAREIVHDHPTRSYAVQAEMLRAATCLGVERCQRYIRWARRRQGLAVL